jgi:hypothetical protein
VSKWKNIIKAAQSALIHGGKWLDELPAIVVEICDTEAWKTCKDRNGEVFSSFTDMICAELPEGFGITVPKLRKLVAGTIAERPLAVAVGEEQATTVKPGRPDEEKRSNGTNIQTSGNGSEYLLRRLAKTAPEFVDRYEAGEFPSVRQAAIAAGIVKVPTVMDRLRSAWKKASPADRLAFMEEISK